MTTPWARILPATEASRAVPWLAPGASPQQRRRIARDELEARLDAERIVGDARVRADQIVTEAQERARGHAALAVIEAREKAEAELAAAWLSLRQAEQERLTADADRIIDVATALAERLIGAELELDSGRIAHLARTALAEARGARRAIVEAHPLDVEALRRHFTAAGFDATSVDVKADEALARGDLTLQTDVGTIDAKLAPRLDRLAAALRDGRR